LGILIIICSLILEWHYTIIEDFSVVISYPAIFHAGGESLLSLCLPVGLCAAKTYHDPVSSRDLIRAENNGKAGVYCWANKANGKFYVGSGDPLYLRLSDYYQPWYLLARTNLYVVRALSKHGLSNFSLVILEYTSSEDLIACEQKWIDLLKPEYNTNPTAGSSKGYIHTAESIEKMCIAGLGW